VPPTGDCKPFQEVLIELGSRLKLPTFVTPAGQRKYRDYRDFIVNWETEPGRSGSYPCEETGYQVILSGET